MFSHDLGSMSIKLPLRLLIKHFKTWGNKSVMGSDCCHSREFLTNIILANEVLHHLTFINLIFRSYSSQKQVQVDYNSSYFFKLLILCDEKVNSRCKWPNWHEKYRNGSEIHKVCIFRNGYRNY